MNSSVLAVLAALLTIALLAAFFVYEAIRFVRMVKVVPALIRQRRDIQALQAALCERLQQLQIVPDIELVRLGGFCIDQWMVDRNSGCDRLSQLTIALRENYYSDSTSKTQVVASATRIASCAAEFLEFSQADRILARDPS